MEGAWSTCIKGSGGVNGEEYHWGKQRRLTRDTEGDLVFWGGGGGEQIFKIANCVGSEREIGEMLMQKLGDRRRAEDHLKRGRKCLKGVQRKYVKKPPLNPQVS